MKKPPPDKGDGQFCIIFSDECSAGSFLRIRHMLLRGSVLRTACVFRVLRLVTAASTPTAAAARRAAGVERVEAYLVNILREEAVKVL